MQKPDSKKKRNYTYDEESVMIEIFENVKIIYNDDIEERFEAVQKIEKGLNIGRIVDNKFLFFGFIPMHNVKEISKTNVRKIRQLSF